MFQAEAAERRALSACWAGWIAVLAFNVMLSAIYIANEVDADTTRVLIAAQVIVTLPSALFLFALRRRPDAKWREVMLVGGYGLVTLGAIALDQHMANDAALYFAFASALIPVFGNIVAPISFIGAAIGSVVSVAALIVSALWGQRFSAGAEFAMILLYGGGAAATLVANYRFESYERLNYLMRLKKTLHKDELRAWRRTHCPTSARQIPFRSAQPGRIRRALHRRRKLVPQRKPRVERAVCRYRQLQALQRPPRTPRRRQVPRGGGPSHRQRH